MDEDKGTFAERNMTKRLDNEAARLKLGYWRATLLPVATLVIAFVICAYALRHFCIEGTIFDTTKAPKDRDVYSDAQRDYYDGNLDAAATQAARILAKEPNHSYANQLMARIELTRGHPQAALEHLRRSLNTSLNRDDVAKWIASLEAAQSK